MLKTAPEPIQVIAKWVITMRLVAQVIVTIHEEKKNAALAPLERSHTHSGADNDTEKEESDPSFEELIKEAGEG